MSYRIINPEEQTPIFALDTEDDLPAILKEPYYNEQGTAAIVLSTGNVYLLNSARKWVKL